MISLVQFFLIVPVSILVDIEIPQGLCKTGASHKNIKEMQYGAPSRNVLEHT